MTFLQIKTNKLSILWINPDNSKTWSLLNLMRLLKFCDTRTE